MAPSRPSVLLNSVAVEAWSSSGKVKGGRLARGMRTRRARRDMRLERLGVEGDAARGQPFAHVARQPFELRRRCDAQPQRRIVRAAELSQAVAAQEKRGSARAGLFQGVDGGGDLRLGRPRPKRPASGGACKAGGSALPASSPACGESAAVSMAKRSGNSNATNVLMAALPCTGEGVRRACLCSGRSCVGRARRSNLRRFSCGARARRPPALRRSP